MERLTKGGCGGIGFRWHLPGGHCVPGPKKRLCGHRPVQDHLQDAAFFGGKITDDKKGYKYNVTQNGFRTKESKEYLDLNELTNKDLSFYVKF